MTAVVVTENQTTNVVEVTARGPQGPGGNLGNYGSFYDTTDQPLVAANVAQRVNINTTLENRNVTIVDGGKITFDAPGVYSLTFTLQLTNSENNTVHGASAWIKYNGTNWPYSASHIHVPGARSGDPGETILAVNFVATAVGNGDYVEIYWTGESTVLSVDTVPANGSVPAAPGVILTVVQVMYLQVPA